MSKNVKINNTTYSGIKSVLIPLANSSGNAQFRDEDEVITKPTATKTITANGSNIDVMDYAKVTVNVPTESELSLNGITTSPASVTVAADATVDTVKAAIMSATASYTASGYTGTMTKAITVSELTVSGTVPANGTTGNMTVSWGGKSTTLSVTVQSAQTGETSATATVVYEGTVTAKSFDIATGDWNVGLDTEPNKVTMTKTDGTTSQIKKLVAEKSGDAWSATSIEKYTGAGDATTAVTPDTDNPPTITVTESGGKYYVTKITFGNQLVNSNSYANSASAGTFSIVAEVV